MWIDDDDVVEEQVMSPPPSKGRAGGISKRSKRSPKPSRTKQPSSTFEVVEEVDQGEAAFAVTPQPPEVGEIWDDDMAEEQPHQALGEEGVELPGTTGDNNFDAGGVSASDSVIPVGRGFAQITHAGGEKGASASASSGKEAAETEADETDSFLEFVPSGADSRARPATDDVASPLNPTSAAQKHATITRREVTDLAQRRVMIRNEGILAGGRVNRDTIDPYFRRQLESFRNHSNVVFRNAANVLEQVLLSQDARPNEAGGANIEVDRAADCQLFISQDCHVDLLLKILKQVTKSPYNWLSSPHDISLLNAYAITRDRQVLLSLARTPGTHEPVPECPNGKQCASRMLDPPFPRGRLPVSDLDLNHRFGGDRPHPCVFCASFYNATVTTLMEFLGTPVPSWVVISRVQFIVDGPWGVSRDLMRFPRCVMGIGCVCNGVSLTNSFSTEYHAAIWAGC